MLVKGIAQKYDGRVRVAEENFGESELATRFGVKRYPAVFVNDVLVAKPKDFGFFGSTGSQGKGRYTPWLNKDNQARFHTDMQRIVAQALRGELDASQGVEVDEGSQLTHMPDFSIKDIAGLELDASRLRETVTVVEFWATWCPPCIKALPWLSELQLQHEGKVQVVGIAVESPEEGIRKIADRHELPFPVVAGNANLAIAFGDIVAVPTTFVFAKGGKLARVFHGSPPDLKVELEALVKQLNKESAK